MKKVQWVRHMYNDWRNYRNTSDDLQSVECDIEDIYNLSQESLKNTLCLFLTEVKCVDGEEFPVCTMYDVVICLQFWLESNGLGWKLISGEVFSDVKFPLDNIMKSRYEAGIGKEIHQAEVIGIEEEDILWNLGLLGMHSPEVLLNTLVYMIGLHCALRAGKEHRVLRSIPFESQFEYIYEPSGEMYVRFSEDGGMKMNKGGLKHRKFKPKVVEIYPSENSGRCAIAILSKYLSLLLSNRKSLYLQPKKKFTANEWYLDRPVGVNTLRDTIKDICKNADFPSFYSNHSFRSSSATRMYRGG